MTAATYDIELPPKTPAKLKHLGGSDFDEVNGQLMAQVANTLFLAGCQTEADRSGVITSATLMAQGLNPADQVEGMLVAQLIACHFASMECYRRAMIEGQHLDGRRENLNQANKLSRTSTTLVEALNKHRGKGQQKVVVEHVHIHGGAQAIVGNVTPGGRAVSKFEEQSHEPKGLAAPDGAAVPCSFQANKAAMPQSCDPG